jgi:serine phosphatase RsbU (regulator of sigma subunit)
MALRPPKLLQALWSRAAADELYARRKAAMPAEENRTVLAVVVTSALFAGVLAFMMHLAWSRQDVESYLRSRSADAITYLTSLDSTWRYAEFAAKTCVSGDDCRAKEVARLAAVAPAPGRLGERPFALPPGVSGTDLATTAAAIEIPTEAWRAFALLRTAVLTLPAASYRRADLYVDGEHQATFWNGAMLSYTFDPVHVAARGADAERPLRLEVVFEVQGGQRQFVAGQRQGANRLEHGLAVMSRGEFDDYREFIASNKAGRGDWIGAIARIAIAVFVLALFLVIDGSPESLGLGLFFGFEAIAISMRYNWLPLADSTAVAHYCYQMGDILRLYFFLQLARVIDKRVGVWLLWGTVLSVPYGILRQYAPSLDWAWPGQIPLYRDLVVGTLGLAACVRSATYLWGRGAPWRVTALALAAVGAFEQSMESIFIHIPIVYETAWFTTMMDALQPASAWLLAFSAFLNISTLENRVKALSGELSRAQQIRTEMELGRSVQRAFMTMPELPKTCHLVCHHEAMLYVSGDTFFVHWAKRRGRLTFLVNDVTGHGVQAALKASATSVIARALWDDRASAGDEGAVSTKLATYDAQLCEFMGQMSDEPDVPALGGAEVDLRTGEVTLYRANFPFPIVVERKPTTSDDASLQPGFELWRPALVPLANRHVTLRQLAPGSLIILASDGFIDTSRKTADFLAYLRRYLATKDETLAAEAVRDAILRSDLFAQTEPRDDRTLLVFQWDGPLAETAAGAPESGEEPKDLGA